MRLRKKWFGSWLLHFTSSRTYGRLDSSTGRDLLSYSGEHILLHTAWRFSPLLPEDFE